MIHADLHFGNLVWNQSQGTPIDFDDCGYGSKLYDAAVFLLSSRFGITDEKKLGRFIDDFIGAYSFSLIKIQSKL